MHEVIRYLPPEALLQIAEILEWAPEVQGERTPFFSMLTRDEKCRWLARNRDELVIEIRLTGGHTIANLWRRLRGKSAIGYGEILRDIAEKLGLTVNYCGDEEVEQRIVSKLWCDTLTRLTSEQREELIRKAKEESEKHGISSATWAGSVALGGGLAAANLAGFGLYIAASTILGAINGALGMGLGFGAFMGMSKLIAVAIGPAGWLLFIASMFVSFGGPNYKKLIPIVVMVAAYRQDVAVKLAKSFHHWNSSEWVEALGEVPAEAQIRKNRLQYLERIAVEGQRAWPDEVRWTLLRNLIEFLEGNDEVGAQISGWFASEVKTDRSGTIKVAEKLIEYVTQIEPTRRDAFLNTLLDSTPQFAELCYTSATNFSTAHHRAVFLIAERLITTIETHQGSHAC